jgi:hypothetical protein
MNGGISELIRSSALEAILLKVAPLADDCIR